MPVAKFEEHEFDIDGLKVRAKYWRGSTKEPVIALHGWLDNAASFDAMGEQGLSMLAIDAPGHGLSDHKPPHASYQIWDDLLIILAIADAMGWERFSLLGHSRGAIMSTLLAASCPERVNRVMCIDGLMPQAVRVEDTAKQLSEYLRDYRRLSLRKAKIYKTVNDIVGARLKVMPMRDATARKLSERAAHKVPGGYIVNNDPRLKAASAFKLTDDHIQAMLKAVRQPLLLIVADSGYGQVQELNNLISLIRHCQVERFAGGHHLHMEEASGEIARLAKMFLDSE